MPAHRHFISARIRVVIVTAVALATTFMANPAAAATGPYLVKDINTSGDSFPSELTVLGSKVYFSAAGGGKGRELWMSDGTAAGTVRVKDIRPGSAGSSPQNLAAIGGLLYFSADSGNGEGRELYRSDGTNAGTWAVYDINPGSGDSTPFSFFGYNGVVYFSADDGVHGRELWRSEGAFGTTRMVKDIAPGSEGSNPGGFVPLGATLVFEGNSCLMSVCSDTLYKTNGTRRGTKALKDHDGNNVAGDINWLVAAGPRMYFSFNQTQLWRSNGTAAKTLSLGDIPAWEIVAVGDRVFFEVGCCGGGELWKSGGSVASTMMVKAFPDDGGPYNLVDLGGGTLFFFSGGEPWTSDGTPDGTQPIGKQVGSDSNFAVLDSVVYFGGRSDDSAAVGTSASPNFVPAPTLKLWRSDGTTDGTFSVSDTPDAHIRYVTTVGASVFFTADNGPEGTELWRYVP